MMRVQPPKKFGWKQDVERYGWDPVRHHTISWIGDAVYINPGADTRIQVTEENAEQFGFTRYETAASKIARLEWEVEMLEEKLALGEEWKNQHFISEH